MAVMDDGRPPAARRGASDDGLMSIFFRRETRQIIYQVAIVVTLVAFFWMIISNAAARRQGRAWNAEFLNSSAGFDISQTLIPYSAASSNWDAFMVGILNTIFVSAIAIVLATILGFVAGIARLSSNWLIAKVAAIYVEITRNIPLLLHLLIWYFGVIKNLPGIFKQSPTGDFLMVDGKRVPGSVELGGGILLNNRGLFLPKPEFLPGSRTALFALVFGIIASILVAMWARRRQLATGQQFPVLWTSLALILILPIGTFLVMGRPVQFEHPTVGRFNMSGGIELLPELAALLIGLVFYTGGYIAEIVRAGILGVSKGQKEAARAIGLTNGQALRLVVIPQALRIIIPPLTSNYLNVTKNSSLGIAIGYPDLVGVFTGTVLNQKSGHEIEIVLMTMAVYLTLSLLTSLFMNWFNKRMALVER
ncbi:MAG TPA: ABC transporter permease subunit [Hyphomicrobiaceae bacterium]|nr:ABC transporter permease subunit [Hyphomicrobiaceae bacterium]